MMAPSWRCNCQSGVRRSSSSVDSGSASNLGLVIGSLSRAHWSIVKLGLLFNREFSYPLSHSALPLTCRARLLMTRLDQSVWRGVRCAWLPCDGGGL
jgi:hypothetical protein